MVVTSLAYDAANQELYAGTYGRSVFSISTAVIPCPWDCGDGNGEVDTVDFLAQLAQWGQQATSCDFDANGVDTVDFLALLANWGPCPTAD